MIEIQNKLQKKIVVNSLMKPPVIVSGFDTAYSETHAFGIIVTLNYKNLELLEIKNIISTTKFSYIPGFLAFQELPIFLEIWAKLTVETDLVFFDGHGINHHYNLYNLYN
jgi:deoxyribonuclease V